VLQDAITERSNETSRTANREPPARWYPSMHELVGEQNISRFVDEFQTAHDANTRLTLKKLLLEEENKFAFNSEQLVRIQQRINECKARIDLQERLIHKARIKGHNVAAAERVLDNLVELQEIFWSHHQVVLEAVNRSKL
jgi:hypothetical protein